MYCSLCESDVQRAFEKYLSVRGAVKCFSVEISKDEGAAVIISIMVFDDGYMEIEYMAVNNDIEIDATIYAKNYFETQFKKTIWDYQQEHSKLSKSGERIFASSMNTTRTAENCLTT